MPGVRVAVVKDDSVVYLKGFGTREAGTSQPVDGNTVFATGSSSKAFTAARPRRPDRRRPRWHPLTSLSKAGT